MNRPRVLVLAESCNPDWPSLPVVGYKYALALGTVADVTIATHTRNKPNIDRANPTGVTFSFVDNESVDRLFFQVGKFLRGGTEVAWSTGMMMKYLPYLLWERKVLKTFQTEISSGDFDLVHRITPMSPTLPSFMSGRTKQPFFIGPLNGNLDWPSAFAQEQKRERETLRRLRDFYKYLPFAQSTFRKSDCILAAFQHTIDDIDVKEHGKIVPMPEIGFDPDIFFPPTETVERSNDRPLKFLYAGRLVPYKVPEVAVRSFATSDILRKHTLHVVGDGPELPRLEKIVEDANAGDCIRFEGQMSQSCVADMMRECDVFVFPSIRELGAGVVIEAMACGMALLVTDYGAPGDLAANGRGVRVPLQPLEGLTKDFRLAMEKCAVDWPAHISIAQKGREYATEYYEWKKKAQYTLGIYEAVLKGEPLDQFVEYR